MARRRFMQSFPGISARSLSATRIHPALTSFADEVCATVARLFAYMGTLALLGIVTIHGWDQVLILTDAPALKPGWRTADRSYPAFAVGNTDSHGKSVSYTILRHPQGGRKDILRWMAAGDEPMAELEIYRPGVEFNPATGAGLATRMGGTLALETAGVLDSKFGAVALLGQAGVAEAKSCLAFFKRIDDPALQISGFSCAREGLPARRAAVGCMLDRLTLLVSGNEPKLAELFAHAELKRGGCAPPNPMADWMSSAENPQLRGAL
jgi:hypothetical protein